MPTHLTYKDALSQDPQMSRLLMAIQTAGTSTELPGHRGSDLKTLPDHQVPHSPARSSHHTHPITLSPSIQAGIQLRHPLPPPPTGLPTCAPPTVPVPRPSSIQHISPKTPPVDRKPYASPSDDEFSDGEIDHLINLFEDLSTDRPSPPSQGTYVACPVLYVF
jgi:hypothetical protein